MPLNKLENFIKNTEGRILYVNPNDLDATDGVENQGNSLTKPFKTVQRAILEAARFSYLRGDYNDLVEKTTILLFPGEHIIDNRPGYAISNINNVATVTSPSGTQFFAGDKLSLTLDSNFDLTQSDNILYKFNSINGGVVVPRGTSIVGLDLRKTKIRPLYVPNPTDSNVNGSAIFKITGACYFWQFTIFDGKTSGLVYTDPTDFSSINQAIPTFSHHKLTCFEYADGVNLPSGFDLTDLDMYYSKISNAFNLASGRDIDQKYPASPGGLAKQRPEWEIVGAFATDPINISSIISGDGATPGSIVTVQTQYPHGLTAGTPIKIRNVNVNDYNVSSVVQTVINATTFTYLLNYVRINLPAGPAGGLSGSSATVTIETDTVTGASPYIFNISLRSVWGMNGMHANGSKASGFRSMVVAQFTAVSLQKDDRAFVKYNQQSRTYDGIAITKVTGSALSSGSSSTDPASVYHLDASAIYRKGWKPSHIKVSNDSFIQIVSVFAIGFNKHFDVQSGGDASITNSNSNFGQYSLSADGFKYAAFDKDNKAYITSVVTPRAIKPVNTKIEWVQFDVQKTISAGQPGQLYLFGYYSKDLPPPIIAQGYRIGARIGDQLYIESPAGTQSAAVYMCDNIITAGNSIASGSSSSEKTYFATNTGSSIFTINGGHSLSNGEKIRVYSDVGDYPENIFAETTYYAITSAKDGTLAANQIRIASSNTNASAGTPIYITTYGGNQIRIVSRVCDKLAGDIGSPIQWDPNNTGWYIHVDPNNTIYSTFANLGYATLGPRSEISYVYRTEDSRGLDEKLYKVRVVIPKELVNGRDPESSFVIQESSTTGARTNADFSLTGLTSADYLFNRNPRFITTCTYDPVAQIITVLADQPHNLQVNDSIIVLNVSSTTNTNATQGYGYNGTFKVIATPSDRIFTYSTTDIYGTVHAPGLFTNNTNVRSVSLPRFERNDLQTNLFIYRTDVITPYIYNVQDGVYYVYMLNASNGIGVEFTDLNYKQSVINLYPQMDKDNILENPPSSKTFAKRSPLGEVITSDLKKSITRETIDRFYSTFDNGNRISSVAYSDSAATLYFDREHQLAGLAQYSTLNGGSGHTNGTYYNVKLFNTSDSPSFAVWDGASATVTVSGGSVVSADITSRGSGYSNNRTLYFDSSVIGGTPSANIIIKNEGISLNIGDVVQVTGIGTTSSNHYRITATSNKYNIGIARTIGDPTPVAGQYAIHVGPSVTVSSTLYDSPSGITTFTTSGPHGLLSGNAFKIIDSSNNNLGNYKVQTVLGVTQFSAQTNTNVSASAYVLKHGLAANDAIADVSGENLGTRGLPIYGKESAILGADITTETQFTISLITAGIGTSKRFNLGSYIQIDNEIMRITSSTLLGAGNNQIQVIRGAMGTIRENHANGSLIRKIKLTPIEFRRPSILRASGHTFEYLGYGPGNYSTALPQVQVKTLTGVEDFLSQAQQSSCGTVIYTGMNSSGDFFVGNTKYSAASGQQITFDIPTPTVTGQDPNILSVSYDEVIIKQRLVVEGGNSGNILSQFNGPVTFNGELKITNFVSINADVRSTGLFTLTNTTDSTNVSTGTLVVAGGVGIGKNLNVGGLVGFINTTQSTSTATGALVVSGGVGIAKNVYIGGNTDVAGTLYVHSTTSTTSSSTGAAVISGGVGIGGGLHVGSNVIFDSNLTVSGTSLLSGNTTCGQNLTVGGSATVNALNINTSGMGQGDLGSNGGSDGIFGIYNTTNGGQTSFNVKDSSGANNNILQLFNGNATINGKLYVTDDIYAFYSSDQRLKDNITPIPNALDKVLSISGNTFDWNEESGKQGTEVGVIAQEILEVLPEVVTTRENGYLAVRYEKLVPLLIEAIKELKSEIDELKRSK